MVTQRILLVLPVPAMMPERKSGKRRPCTMMADKL